MNSTPPPLPSQVRSAFGSGKRGSWPAFLFLAIGIAPALVGLFLVYGTHYHSPGWGPVLRKFFAADTVCALISGVGIGFRVTGQLWLRLLIALLMAVGLWLLNALAGLFVGCVLTMPGR